MRFVFAFTTLWLGTAGICHAETTAVEVYRNILAKSPKVRASEASVRAAEENLGANPSFPRPKIDVYGNVGLSETNPSAVAKSSDPISSAVGVRFSQSLYDFGKTSLAHERSSIAFREAKAQQELSKRDVQREVAKSVLESSRLQQSLEVLQTLEGKLKGQFGLVERQYRSGMKSRKDYLRFMGDYRRIQRDVQRTGALTRESMNHLQLESGLVDGWKHVNAEVSSEMLNYDVTKKDDQILALIEELGRELKQTTLAEARRAEGLELALAADASYGGNGFLNSDQSWSDVDSDHWSLMLTFNYNLIDFGMKRHRIAAAVAKFDEGSAILDQSKLDRAANEGKVQEQWIAAKVNYQSARELLKLEEESFAILDSEYKQGRLSYIDYMQGFQNLSSAKTGAIDAGFAVRKALVEIIYLNGGSNEVVLQ